MIFCRNKFFIKFPGRNLGGFWAFFQPLTMDAWLVCLLFLIVVPGFLFICYKVLSFFNIFEKVTFGYGQNIFLLFNAFSQQVYIVLDNFEMINDNFRGQNLNQFTPAHALCSCVWWLLALLFLRITVLRTHLSCLWSRWKLHLRVYWTSTLKLATKLEV